MKKILFCLPLLLLALQSCEIEDEYMYDKGLYTIDWDAAADSSSVTLIDRFWNTEENYFNYGNDGSIKDFHYWPQAHAMDVMIDAYNRTGVQRLVRQMVCRYQGKERWQLLEQLL